jgi:hypothetical protein
MKSAFGAPHYARRDFPTAIRMPGELALCPSTLGMKNNLPLPGCEKVTLA